MPTLSQRVDRASITATFLALPKGKKRGRAVGFLGGDPVATVQSSGNDTPPFQWIDGKPQVVTFEDVKKLVPSGTSPSQLTGFWFTTKHDERALVWTRSADGLAGVALHPERWEKSAAAACGDGQQVGYGYERFVKDPKRALLWSGSAASLVVLTGPDPATITTANGVSEGVQVGVVGGSWNKHACLWRGTSASFLDLHPAKSELNGSEALGIGDGQQVGHVWGKSMMPRAALWSGSPESYVDLSPAGWDRSTAWRCARGFQVGWAEQEIPGSAFHAILWGGDGDDHIDLQQSLPDPWNCSQAMHLDVDGDTLRILGTAQQVVKSGGYDVHAAEQPVLWEMKLLTPEPPARRELPPVITGAAAEVDDDRKVERVASAFARAVIDDDYQAAHKLLAPWLKKQVTAAKLKMLITKQFFADAKAVDFVVSANDTTLDDLRSHYREYHNDDPTRILGSLEEYGDWGPPSIHIADEITPANFRQWVSIDLTPDVDDPSGLDYLLRLYLVVVELKGSMKIGYLEPGE